MKKTLFIFACFYSLTFSEKEIDTADIRRYHQQLEERVFEVENSEEKNQKINEGFLHGKRRIKDLKKNEIEKLKEKDEISSEKLEEVKVLENKYETVLKETEKLREEKEKLVAENKNYEKKLREIEKNGGKN